MKKFTFFLMGLLATSLSFAQNAPINFETGGQGANWTWTVFENATNPPVTFIANPSATGINTSATVARFEALSAGNPWAGCESAHGTTDLGPFVLSASNSIIKIMVWKPVISDVGIKLIAASGWAQPEIKIPNTVINQWEELTFDFSAFPNPPAAEGQYDQIAIFPDFNLAGRGQNNICYFDNITFNPAGGNPNVPTVAAPTPTRNAANVFSIFSDAYTNLATSDLNPNWGQSTVVTQVPIAGNNTLRYGNLNYQGLDLGGSQNLTTLGMNHLHLDFWSANATALEVFLISTGPVETPVALTVPTTGWTSIDIPLTSFAPVNLADVIQFKFVGNGVVYLDNIYFYIAGGTNTSNIDGNNAIYAYPNPVKAGNLIRLSEDVAKIELFDLSGRMVSSTNNSVLNTVGLNEGMYIAKMLTKTGKVQTQKIVVN